VNRDLLKNISGELFFDLLVGCDEVMSSVPPFTEMINILSEIVFLEFWKISATMIGYNVQLRS